MPDEVEQPDPHADCPCCEQSRFGTAALFALIGALAEKLTGERPCVQVERKPGQWVGIEAYNHVTWRKPEAT